MNSLVKFWSALNLVEAPFIHPEDLKQCGHMREFADRQKLDHAKFIESDRFPGKDGFHLSLLPVPYLGDLSKADIFILLLNPGFSISNYESMENALYRSLSARNIQQKFGNAEIPMMSLDPMLSSTAGFAWWHAKFADIIGRISEAKNISYLEALKLLSRRIAAVELVPYRSKSFSASKLINKLPSAIAARKYVHDELVPRSRNGEITLIVTRKAKEWGVSASDAVVYGKTEARSAHLTRNSKGGVAILKRLGIRP